MFKAVGLDVIGVGQVLRSIHRLIPPETRMQLVADDLAVQNVGNFETAKLETVDRRLQFSLHLCGHAYSLRMLMITIALMIAPVEIDIPRDFKRMRLR